MNRILPDFEDCVDIVLLDQIGVLLSLLEDILGDADVVLCPLPAVVCVLLHLSPLLPRSCQDQVDRIGHKIVDVEKYADEKQSQVYNHREDDGVEDEE